MVFKGAYPAIHAHLDQYREALIKRQDQGRYWWELRSCAYWAEFEKPKTMYPEITWRSEWALDTQGMLCNNTAYFLPSETLLLRFRLPNQLVVRVANRSPRQG